jgi:hypothetical protein
MKLFLAVFFISTLFLAAPDQDELQAIEANYDGHYGGVFYFVDMEGSSHIFHDIESQAQEKYDLTDGTCDGNKFLVVYRIVYETPEDKEDEDDYGECIIVHLELIG